MIALGYAVSLAYGIVCLLLAAVCYKFGMPKIYTRKLVHILVGFEWVILYCFHGASVHFLAVCLAFLALLIFVSRKKLMPMISSEGDNSPGTVYYAVSMSIMAFVCIFVNELIIPFGIAVFCTSFGDGFAGVVGQLIRKCNPKLYKNKSLLGTFANFVFCFLTVFIFREAFSLEMSLLFILFVSVFAVELELFSAKGLDNITLPLGIFSLSSLMLLSADAMNYVLPILITPIIIAVVSDKKMLTSAGIFAAFVLDIVISVSLGNFGFTVLLSFLVLGVLTDKIKKRVMYSSGIEKKSGCRDHLQVLANATVGAICALLFKTLALPVFAVAFAASFAEALADTAASSFGSLSKNTYDVFKFKRTKKGLSGGVSLLGTLASLAFSLLMSLICLPFGFGIKEFAVVAVCGFAGAVFDSFLGSLIQVKYECSVCGETTEKEKHCGADCIKKSGIRWVNNDVVNLVSTVFASSLAALIYGF